MRKRGSSWELQAHAGTDPETGKRHGVSATVKGGRRATQQGLVEHVEVAVGVPVQIPPPRPLNTWQKLSSIGLVVYLIVHVWHRRKRLRRSVIQ
jgi:hypothetical protein